MQYTLRNISSEVNRLLRKSAREQHKSLNRVAVEALERAVGVGEPRKRRDLSRWLGSWEEDPQFDEALQDQRRIGPLLSEIST